MRANVCRWDAGRLEPLRWLLCLAVLAFGLAVAIPVEYASADGYGHGDPVRRGTNARLYRVYGSENLPPCDDATVAAGSSCYTTHEHIAYDYYLSFWVGDAEEQSAYTGQCRNVAISNCWERLQTQGSGNVVRRECLYVAGTLSASPCARPSGTAEVHSGWDRVNFSGVVLTVGKKPTFRPPPPLPTFRPPPPLPTFRPPPPQSTFRPPPVVSIGDVTVTEGGKAVLSINLDGSFPSGGTGSVQYRMVNGTAEAGRDFNDPGDAKLSFSGNRLSAFAQVLTIDDTDVENTETFTVVLSNPVGVVIGSGAGTGTVTILDNDTLATVSISGATITEGTDAELTVRSTGGSGTGTVRYATSNGSATAGNDYTTTSGSLTFSPTQLSHQVRVPTNDDDDDERTEQFTVRLSNASNVSISTAEATVTILDNDTPDPPCPAGTTGTPPNCVPDPCPAGTTGTPPNCVPDPCPAGTTGTPPNCVQILTGCNAAGTRLSALTVTSKGSAVLSGFSPTVYSYDVDIEGASAAVDATAADSLASVRIGRDSPSVGSASKTTLVAQGSNEVEVEVTNSGESCTYTVEISRPDDITPDDCPDGWIPITIMGFTNCQPVADCPYELYGYDPIYLQWAGQKMFGPLWLTDASETPSVPPGGSVTVERTALSCTDHFRTLPSTHHTDPIRHCVAGYANKLLHGSGDCMSFGIRVTAMSPAGEAAGWRYEVTGCGLNQSASRVSTWTADDAVCSSSDGAWVRIPCFGCIRSPRPVVDVGEWQVTLDGLIKGTVGGQDNPYVYVETTAAVTDWGDLALLQVAVVATTRGLRERSQYYGGGLWDYWSEAIYTGRGAESASTVFDVPRQSGPPPADDIIEVNIADISKLPKAVTRFGSNQQFVSILRSELLANDACLVGVDCSNPFDWPISLSAVNGDRCSTRPFLSLLPRTDQGVVGCAEALNDNSDPSDPASVRYWPRLWAAGTDADAFEYSTYGGTATVTVKFTDRAPEATDIVSYDPGTEHTVAGFGYPTERSSFYCNYNLGCSYSADYNRLSGDWANTHHAGSVSLAAIRDGDPDGDASLIAIVDGHNPHLRGTASAVTETGTRTAKNYSQWLLNQMTDTPSGTPVRGSGLSHDDLFVSFNQFYSLRPVNPLDSSTPMTRSRCSAHTDAQHSLPLGYGRPSTGDYPATLYVWSSAADTDPGCVPSVPDDCGDSTMLAAWSVCYSLWPQSANPQPLVVDYRACDKRLEAAISDSGVFAEYLTPLIAPSVPRLTDTGVAHLIRHRIAGNTRSPHYYYTDADWNAAVVAIDAQLGARYCGDGTITVLLGDTSTVSMQPTATATEGLSLGFVVTLDQPSAVEVTVTFSTRPDTAGTDPAEASDYRARTDAQVTIPAGQTQAPVEVLTVQDSIHENDETLRVVVTAANGARLGADLESVGTIVNDDTAPVVGFVGDVSSAEDNAVRLNPPRDVTGDGIVDNAYVYGESARFTVRLTGNSARQIMVDYSIADGTATGVSRCPSFPGNTDADYRQNSGTLTFAPGETSKTVTIRFCPDNQVEPDETFTVTLSNPVDATLGADTATGTISNNDIPSLLR